jgi:hypothetical protein
MPRNPQPSPGGRSSSFLASQPTTVAFAMVVLVALIILALLRHLFGSVRVEAGTR